MFFDTNVLVRARFSDFHRYGERIALFEMASIA